MLEAELFDIIRPIILLVTGVPECIISDPDAPSPSGEYASVSINSSINQRGQAIDYSKTGAAPNTVDLDIRAQLISEASVNFWRGDATHYASLIPQANKRPAVQEMLFNAEVGWQKVGPVNKLTGLQSDNFESRAQISIFLLHEQPMLHDIPATEPVNSIEVVPCEIQDENADIITSDEIRSPDAPVLP